MIQLLLLTLCLSSCGVVGLNGNDKDVEYYMNLIAEETSKAEKFVLPTDNRRYFGDSVPDENEAKDFGVFDFIIVGAGSSGSVVINRLSKVKKWKILVLEAGGNETDFSDIPSMAFFTHLSDMNWGYNTTSQNNSCLGMVNNQCFYPRGRVLGGSGTINALMYVRGNKNDYDSWATQGNPGWSYESILPYFKKSEHSEIDDGDSGFHSESGLWKVIHTKPPHPLTDYFFQANSELGNEQVDYNGENQMGYSRLQMNIDNGKRASGGRSFIDSVCDNSNVQIVLNALVTKVLINNENTAYGVNFLKDGELYTATVKNEVVISAGAVNTPQLLMLSGIGPREHLKKLDIPLVKDLPVGKHFQDHPVFISLNIRTNYTMDKPPMAELVQEYLQGEGMYTYCLNTQAIKFTNTLNPKSEVPDIEFIFIPPPSSTNLGQKVFNIKPDIADTLFASINPLTDFRIFLVLLHPKSLGEITLKSNNPLDFPNIDTNYFSDENDEDIETMYRGILHALSLLETSAFRHLNATLHFEFHKCDQFQIYSKDYWLCTIRYLTSTLYHSSGTARMGPDEESSVVNYELKVHGINKLRVGDCSIIPSSTSGHTNAPAFMIGEKLADYLKQEYM